MKIKLLSLLCALLLLVGALPAASALDGEALRSANTLAALNLVDSAGAAVDYNQNAPASRADAVLLLVRLAGAEKAATAAGGSTVFRDVPTSYAPYVAYAVRQGWVCGVSAVEFAPSRAITANARCAMLLRMLGYRESARDFTVPDAAAFAQHIGLVSRRYDGALTRGDVFEMMREALTFPYQNGSGTVIERLVESGTCTYATASALGLLDAELTVREAADRCTAAVFYYDTEIDIAVVRLAKTSITGKEVSAFSYLELAGTEDVRPGDTVYAIGNPLGLGLAVSSGVVSSTNREVDRYALPCVMNTADISQGSSGGALLNVYGQVIAVTSGAYTYGNSMYLAVPVDPVMSADLTSHSWTLKEVKQMEAAKGD